MGYALRMDTSNKFIYKLEMVQAHLTHYDLLQPQTGGIKLLGLLMPLMIKSNSTKMEFYLINQRH